jgi:hypothetical protein
MTFKCTICHIREAQYVNYCGHCFELEGVNDDELIGAGSMMDDLMNDKYYSNQEEAAAAMGHTIKYITREDRKGSLS